MSIVREDITINMMVRNEAPHIWYALMSTLPYVNHAVIIDTGSTDRTNELIFAAKKKFPFLEYESIPCDDSTGWNEVGNFVPNYRLCDVRNRLIGYTRTKWVWVQDGDEIYPRSAVENLFRTLDVVPPETRVIFLPLLWFTGDLKHIDGNAHYNHSGRVFLRDGLSFKGYFPGEMSHYGNEPYSQCPGDARTHIIPFSEQNALYHYEMVAKPWRRTPRTPVEFNGVQPEVFFGERV